MLKVKNLIKNYGSLQVLKGIDFEVKEGTIYGFLGKNGAGKSTTMNILTGLIDYNGGEIYFQGENFKENKRSILKNIGYTPQSPVFYGYMNAYEYLSFIGKLSGMSKEDIKKRSVEVLEIINLTESAKRKIGGYSGGMKQRLGIAVALFNNPKLLFLDEPTSALDPEGRREILEFILGLKKQGVTVFLSTHILSDIERVCDEVSILDQGKIIASGDLRSLKNEYIKPIYDIEIEKNQEQLKNKLLRLDWIQNVKVTGDIVSVYVKDIESTKHEILKVIVDSKFDITSFNLRKSNLEDIFMRLVNENEDI
jgi:ABC-2 type transport system ATP-binding protein